MKIRSEFGGVKGRWIGEHAEVVIRECNERKNIKQEEINTKEIVGRLWLQKKYLLRQHCL